MAWSRSASAVTMMAFLPLVSANSARSGRQPRNRRAVSTEPVRMTAPTRGSVTSAAADLVVGARQELERRRAGRRPPTDALREPPADQHGLGRGLEHRPRCRPRARPARRRPGSTSGKFQGGVDHDHAERLHAAVGELGGDLAQRAGVVAREVDGLGDLGVGLRHGLGAVERSSRRSGRRGGGRARPRTLRARAPRSSTERAAHAGCARPRRRQRAIDVARTASA